MKIFLDLSYYVCDVIYGYFFIELRFFRLCIEFLLENFKGGLYFVVFDLFGFVYENVVYVFIVGFNNCFRYFYVLYLSYIYMIL